MTYTKIKNKILQMNLFYILEQDLRLCHRQVYGFFIWKGESSKYIVVYVHILEMKYLYSTNNYIYDTFCHVTCKGHVLHVKLSKLFI